MGNNSGAYIKITLNKAAKPKVDKKIKILFNHKSEEGVKIYNRNELAPKKEPYFIIFTLPNISASHPDESSLEISPVNAKILSAKKSPPM